MENIRALFNSVGLDFNSYWMAFAILLIGTIVLGSIARFAFGKKSVLNISVSSSIGILFIYGLTVILYCCNIPNIPVTTTLPFATIQGDTLLLFDFFSADFPTLCAEILSMVILAFLVSLVDSWLPKPKNIFSWLFFRVLTVVIGYVLHMLTVWAFTSFAPAFIVTYAPIVLLAILILMLVTGVLKILIGALIATVNPIIGALYTFFFANIIGKQVTKSVLTTAIIAGLIIALKYAGITAIAISSAVLLAYLPIILLLVVVWYLMCCIF